MFFLADTQVLVWFLSGDRRLGAKARAAIIEALESLTFRYSAITAYELVNASRKPRWPFTVTGTAFLLELGRLGVTAVPVSAQIATLAAELALQHRDPHDHMITATAVAHDMTLITSDDMILGSDISCQSLDARL
jgi:PIN domain nuclease of toxin-antitoxin system